MSKFKYEVPLKQITPLLHFQGDTDGACLRASEVKPQLDRFIVNYLGEENIPQSWRLSIPESDDGTQHGIALRYKMRFEGEGKQESKATAHMSYFGNQGSNRSNYVNGVWFPKGVTMTLLVMEQFALAEPVKLTEEKILSTLMDVLEYLVPYFFYCHSFGRRSNKGFGSFVVDKDEPIPFDQVKVMMPKNYQALFVMKQNEGYSDDYGYSQLNDIYVVSAMMKGGISRPYFKGEVQQSLNDGLASEKVFMKCEVFTDHQKDIYDQICKPENKGKIYMQPCITPEARYVRAMLGLTDSYTFGVAKRDAQIERDYFVVSVKDEEEDKEKKVERFANPLLFKPITGQTILFVRRIPDAMYSRPFVLNGKEIKTPSRKEFDLVEFVRAFANTFNERPDGKKWKRLREGEYWAFRKNGREERDQYASTLNTLTIIEEGGN